MGHSNNARDKTSEGGCPKQCHQMSHVKGGSKIWLKVSRIIRNATKLVGFDSQIWNSEFELSLTSK